MASFLSDAERARLSRFPPDVPHQDLVAYFTLSPADKRQIPKTTAPPYTVVASHATLYPATITEHLMSGTRVHFVHLAWTVDGRPRTLHVALRDIDSADVQLQRDMQVIDNGKRAALVMPGHGLFLKS